MESIKSLIKSLPPNKYISKTDKSELENLCKNLDKIKHEKLLEGLNDVINSTKYTKKLKETIENLIKDLQEEGITQEKVNNLIEEAIEEIKEIEEENLEEELDKECTRYNKFTESNPAEYVIQDKSSKSYIYDDGKIRKRTKDFGKIIKLSKEKKMMKFRKNF